MNKFYFKIYRYVITFLFFLMVQGFDNIKVKAEGSTGMCVPSMYTCGIPPCEPCVTVDLTCTYDSNCNGTDVCCNGACVGAGQCGGGGGGTTAPNTCPSGTVYTCGTPVIHSCLIQGTACAWPRRRGAKCDETGSEANGNLREWWWCQSNCSCVSTCSATAPGTTVLTSPSNGSQQANSTVTLAWNSTTFGTACNGGTSTYDVYVWTGGGSRPATATAQVATNSPLTYNFTGGVPGTTYSWQIVANNGQLSTGSEVRTFDVLNNQISGTVFYDDTNSCGGSPWNPATQGAISVSIDGAAGTAINSDGTFSITATPLASHTVAVSLPSGYICSTSPGCGSCSLTGVTTSMANNNFHLTPSREAWWQATGAGVFAGNSAGDGTAIRSQLPYSTTRLILAGAGGTSGALIRGSGNVDYGSGTVSDDLWNTISKYLGKRMNYAYFSTHMGVIPSQVNDWGADTLNKPSYSAAKEFYYHNPAATSATIGSAWAVPSNEKFVVFVNGDLQINANVTVTSGGFVSFIVSGDITVGPLVTSLQGIYLTSQDFITEAAAVPLAVQGNVVTWGSLSLARDLGSGNNLTPAETFTYRPDLLTNMPSNMKIFAMQWNEVAPGTFGN